MAWIRNIGKKDFLDSSSKKFGSVYAQSPRKYSNIEILAKIEGKEAKFFYRKFTKSIYGFDLGQKKFKIISCLCTFKDTAETRILCDKMLGDPHLGLPFPVNIKDDE